MLPRMATVGPAPESAGRSLDPSETALAASCPGHSDRWRKSSRCSHLGPTQDNSEGPS